MSLTVFLLKIQILPNAMLDLGMREADTLVKVCTIAKSITETLLGEFAVLQGNYGFLKNDAELLNVRNGTAKHAKLAKFFSSRSPRHRIAREVSRAWWFKPLV